MGYNLNVSQAMEICEFVNIYNCLAVLFHQLCSEVNSTMVVVPLKMKHGMKTYIIQQNTAMDSNHSNHNFGFQ